jgi:hypothetical protein
MPVPMALEAGVACDRAPVSGFSAFLIHAQNQRLFRRIQIQVNDVADSMNKLRIAAEFEGLDAMWLQPVGFPDAVNGCITYALRVPHRRCALMSRILRFALQRRFHDRRLFFRADVLLPSAARGILKNARQTGSGKSATPLQNELFVVANSRASCALGIPAAAASTILIRNANFWGVLPARSNASMSSRSPLLIVICSAVCAISQTQDTQAHTPSPTNSEAEH